MPYRVPAARQLEVLGGLVGELVSRWQNVGDEWTPQTLQAALEDAGIGVDRRRLQALIDYCVAQGILEDTAPAGP